MAKVQGKYIFRYPEQFVTLPEYSAHRNWVVTVLRELRDSEYDYEGDRMYEVQAKDGWRGHAWDSELEKVL